jgi:hypothetical protein
MLRNILAIAVVLLGLQQSYAQERGTNITSDPVVGGAESSFFNTSKTLSKGQMAKSYNLFSKNLNAFNLNISLDYDGGNGLKIYNPGSVVGKGWKLDVGGMIVREKRGRADEDFFNKGMIEETGHEDGPINHNHDYVGVLHTNNNHWTSLPNDQVHLFDLSEGDTIYNVYNRYIDNSYDVFNFNMLGRNGKFVLYKEGGVIKAKTFPKMNIKVNVYMDYEVNKDSLRMGTVLNPTIGAFGIIDEYSNTYLFEKADVAYESIGGDTLSKKNPEIDSWQLKMIIPHYQMVNGDNEILKNAITFDYYKIDLKSIISNPEGFSYVTISKLPTTYNYNEYGDRNLMSPSLIVSTPKSIKFPDGTLVKFNYQHEFIAGKNVGNQTGLLRSIEVIEGHGVVSKKYDFKYQRTKLLGGNLTYEDLSVINDPYIIPIYFYEWYLKAFEYNGKQENSFEYYHSNVLNEASLITYTRDVLKSADYFGYPNGDMTSTAFALSSLSSDNRLPNQNFTHMGMLKQINYRNGAYEHFVYEPNLRDSLGITMTIGGIRIRRHSLIDPTNPMNNRITEYSYKNIADTTKSSGFLGNTPKLVKYFHVHQNTYPAAINTNYYIIHPLGHNSQIANLIGYSAVKEKQYQFNGSNYEHFKTIQYTYTDAGNVNSSFMPADYDYPIDIYMDMPTWIFGHLLNKTEYDRSGKKIREEANTYDIAQYRDLEIKSMKLELYAVRHIWNDTKYFNSIYRKVLAQYYYPITGKVNLASKTFIEYDLSNGSNLYSTSKSETYTYNNLNQLSSKFFNDNNGQHYKSNKYYYLDDYDIPTLVEKYDKNNNLIEAVNYEYVKSSRYLVGSHYPYLKEAAAFPMMDYSLAKIYQSRMTSPVAAGTIPLYNGGLNIQPGRALELVEQKSIDSYGNTISETDEFGVKTHYLYDKYQKPIATFHNGESNQFKYFSFEDYEQQVLDPEIGYIEPDVFNNTRIGLSGSRISLSDTQAISGSKAIEGDFFIEMPAGKYHIKLWAKGSGILIVGPEGVVEFNQLGTVVNLSSEWKLYDFSMVVPTNGRIDFGIFGGYLDNLMIYPENGSITAMAYHYNTASGAQYFLRTFSTVPNGMVSIADFDRNGRPLNVRDHKQNIKENKVYVEP